MTRADMLPGRPFALFSVAAVLVAFGFGTIGPASATTSSGEGADHASSVSAVADETPMKDTPPGQAKMSTVTGQGVERSVHADGTKPASNGRGAAKVKRNDDRHTPMGEQPVSNADQNIGGANGQCSDAEPDAGYFCGTVRDKASGNGQGNGHATGKPWQAHVGKADNKNPPGQSENDDNNGYECDGNQGIAKGNPAHTSCAPSVVTTAPPEEAAPPVSIRPPTVAGVEQLAQQPPAGVQTFAGPTSGILPSVGASRLMDSLAPAGLGLLLLGAATLLLRRRVDQS